MKPHVRLNRLKKLEYMLLNHDGIFPKVEFDMGCWIHKAKCGTAACAFGSAGLYPPFKRAGLKTTLDNSVNYKGNSGIYAASIFFGVSEYEARHIFMSYSYFRDKNITPEHVAKRVNKLIEKYTKEKL